VDISTQIKVNAVFSMKRLLLRLGTRVWRTGSILCPFHEDTRRSAKYYEQSDEIFCFAEFKTYRAYDCLRALGASDRDILAKISRLDIKIESRKRVEYPLFQEDAGLDEAEREYRAGRLPLAQYLLKIKQTMLVREE